MRRSGRITTVSTMNKQNNELNYSNLVSFLLIISLTFDISPTPNGVKNRELGVGEHITVSSSCIRQRGAFDAEFETRQLDRLQFGVYSAIS